MRVGCLPPVSQNPILSTAGTMRLCNQSRRLMHRRKEIDWALSNMTPKAVPAAPGSDPVRQSPLGTRRVVQTEIKIIKIIYHEPGKESEDQYGGDPSEDVGPPFPPVVDQQPIHVSPHCRVRVVRRAAI